MSPMPSKAAATPAIASESVSGEKAKAVKVRLGSGVTVRAAMPQKCNATIASVRIDAAANRTRPNSAVRARTIDALDNTMPTMIETKTRLGDHSIRAGASSAAMPR